MNMIRIIALAAFLIPFAVTTSPTARAQQLSEEMRSLFTEMLPRLDAQLQKKVREAMENNRDYLELSVDEFKRFRDHPANPFEGWDGIDTSVIKGLIRLQFETQPIRSRVPDSHERQSTELLDSLVPVTRRANAGTVQITNGKTQVALGIIATGEGHVLTKLSEVVEFDQLFCIVANGGKYEAKIIGKNERNDVAVLKIPAGVVPPAPWADEQPDVGAFIVTTSGKERPLALGVYSNAPRSLIGENQAWLGVKPVKDEQGVRIVEITANSAAERAGLQLDDVVTAINGHPISDVQALVNEIRRNNAGDTILVEYLRQDERGEVLAVLSGRNAGTPTADRFGQMETFGAIQSKRRDNLPLVFQHDTPLVPEQCGGPVTNLDGEVIGMNIARGGRVATYAIPAAHLRQLLGEMLHPSVASRDIE